ncbi:hypothetical protein ACWDXD_24780 [Streptomyces sp. NPDC003314]
MSDPVSCPKSCRCPRGGRCQICGVLRWALVVCSAFMLFMVMAVIGLVAGIGESAEAPKPIPTVSPTIEPTAEPTGPTTASPTNPTPTPTDPQTVEPTSWPTSCNVFDPECGSVGGTRP